MASEEVRKGPWTEQEDYLLANVVSLFGDGRWDFVAKVSGLNRTGKSCRLRWVNYLHPGLKRGKMAAHEERLVLELHAAKWGNRWSIIARRLPGRTDNEIKNYWRTHMRKKAQEQKKSTSPSPKLSDSSSSNPTIDSESFYNTGGLCTEISLDRNKQGEEVVASGHPIDDIWNNIDMTCESPISQLYHAFGEGSSFCYLKHLQREHE